MNSPLILRSPSLADGGDVRVVRLYETRPHARGGLARAAPAREALMHVSPREMEQLTKQWGAPYSNPETGRAEYGFAHGALLPLARFAEGGSTTPSPLSRRTPGTPNYETYGEGPEFQFFNRPVMGEQRDIVHLPSLPSGPRTQSGTSGSPGLAQAGGALAGASQVAGMLGYDNALTQTAGALGKAASGNYAGAAKDASKLIGGGGASLGSIGSGQAANAATQSALGGGVTPLGSGAGGVLTASAPAAVLATDIGAIGSGAAANAALAEAGFGSGAAAGAGAGASGAGAGALASSGLTTAMPLAALGWMAADALNKSGDIKSAASSALLEQLSTSQGWERIGGRVPTWKLPDGRMVRADARLRAASEAWRKGDQAAFEAAYQDWMDHAYTPGGDRSFKDWAQGRAHGGHLSSRYVRGPGTGRSDSIPAQLSDGEYVLTAEDVALLGDGSNEAGAKRLDDFRAQLRKHKGGALARGKISPDAKAPMEYLREGS